MTENIFVGNLTQQTVQNLGHRIASGEFKENEPLLSEADLCTELGVSRTTLREAVKMLTAKGMLKASPRRGTIVLPEGRWNLSDPHILQWLLQCKQTLPTVIEFADMRLALEPAAAALAARRATGEQLQILEAAIGRMEAAERGEDDALAADVAFHVAVLGATNNRFFWHMRHTIEVALKISIRITNRAKGVDRANVGDHRKILDHIVRREPMKAEKAMRTLVSEAHSLLMSEHKRSRKAKP